jgi:hypothetical protein
VVLVRDPGAEDRHGPVARKLVDSPLEAVDPVGKDLEETVEDAMPLLGIDLLVQLHRALHVGEKYRYLIQTQRILNKKHLGWALLKTTTAVGHLLRGQTNFVKMLWKFNSVYDPRRAKRSKRERSTFSRLAAVAGETPTTRPSSSSTRRGWGRAPSEETRLPEVVGDHSAKAASEIHEPDSRPRPFAHPGSCSAPAPRRTRPR